jgi:hypothetical protein
VEATRDPLPLRIACRWGRPTLVHQKRGRSSILYTSAEIIDCIAPWNGCNFAGIVAVIFAL